MRVVGVGAAKMKKEKGENISCNVHTLFYI